METRTHRIGAGGAAARTFGSAFVAFACGAIFLLVQPQISLACWAVGAAALVVEPFLDYAARTGVCPHCGRTVFLGRRRSGVVRCRRCRAALTLSADRLRD